MTDLYCVFGNPIAHSKSPAIHAAFAAQTGQDLRYEARLAPVDDFAGAVAAFVREGGRIEDLAYHSPLFPYLPYAALTLLVISLIGVAFDPSQSAALLFGIPFTLVCLGYFRWRHGAGVFRPMARVAE